MSELVELANGAGYSLDALTAAELAQVRGWIASQYLHRIRQLQPDLLESARAAGIANYHTLPIRFEHATSWPKESRLLHPKYVDHFTAMAFFSRIRQQLGPSAAISLDELNWRIVRPWQPDDVGPVHADKWFWDAGYGYGSMPPGYDRFKVWIGIFTEPGANGLTVKPHSQQCDTWKHHFEMRGGIRKPVLDEDESALGMKLLPLKSGELVLFHDQLLHGGALNRGRTCRVSLELTVIFDKAYGSGRAPAPRRTLVA